MGGTLNGAATGAATGAAFGPWGAAIGAGVGGLMGYFGSRGPSGPSQEELQRRRLLEEINNTRNRGAPGMQSTALGSATMVNTGQADQFRARQMALLDDAQRVSSGQTAGAGELAVQRQGNAALANAAGAATMARGAGAAGARAAARASGGIGLAVSGQAQQAAMGDQSNARNLIASVSGQGRGQDLDTANTNAGATNQFALQQGSMNQQTAMANLEAQLRQRGMNDASVQAYMAMLSGNNRDAAALAQANNASNNAFLGGAIATTGQVLAARRGQQQPARGA